MEQVKKEYGFMLKLATFIVDKRNLFFLITIIALIFSAFSRNWVEVENSLSFYLPEESETKQALDVMADQFTTYGTAQVMVANITYNEASDLNERIAQVKGVQSIAFDQTTEHYAHSSALFTVTFDYDETDDQCLASLDAVKELLSDYDIYVSTELGDTLAETIDAEVNVIMVYVAVIVVAVLILTSRTYGEVPVLLLTFITAMILNQGTNFLLGKISFVFSTILRGAGAYDHYIPSIVKYIPAKEEFLTAYTPYQAEMSQGLLQSIFEYQTMICQLTGMDVSNASVYDGATAAAEAAAMCRERKRRVTLVSAAAHPDVINTIATYCYGTGDEMRLVPVKDGKTDPEALRELLTADVASFYVQQPNFFGQLEDAEALGQLVHEAGAMYIMGCNPIALAIMKTPRDCGADVAVGEGQPLGLPLGYGGPYLGYMATTSKHMRKLPGRIVGETVDSKGETAYVLSLQAREQHIRREKASSNICSNEALCALTASIYMATMGPQGMAEVARQSMAKAHYLAKGLCAIEGVTLRYSGPFFHEFLTDLPRGEQVLAALEQAGILGGLPVEGGILWCATEKASKEALDQTIAIVKEVLAQ